MISEIKKSICSNIKVTKKIFQDENLLKNIEDVSKCIINTLNNGNTIFTCGNGGSMADAIHFTAELMGRFQLNRTSFPSITLGTNVSNILAIANDFGYRKIFSRELSALACRGDVLVLFSTSGKSENIIEAIKTAHEKEVLVIAFLGQEITDYEDLIDFSLHIPSTYTPRIQELHTLIFHSICELVEENICNIT